MIAHLLALSLAAAAPGGSPAGFDGRFPVSQSLNPVEHPHCQVTPSVSLPHGPDPAFDGVMADRSPGVSPPFLKKSTPIVYPRSAMGAAICGVVGIELVVKADGAVSAARVVESLDRTYGLDADALKVAQKWRFEPAKLDDKATAIRTTVRIGYLLEPRPAQADEALVEGQFVIVCGPVHPAGVPAAGTGALAFELGGGKAKHGVRVLMPASAAAQFRPAVAQTDSADICVTGLVERADGAVQITVSRPDQFVPDVPPPGVARDHDPGVIPPKLRSKVEPKYTVEAMKHRIQGDVELSAVVLPDGTIGAVKVVGSLDPTYGLDARAAAALRQWRFEPGTCNGQPCAVMVRIVMDYRLH